MAKFQFQMPAGLLDAMDKIDKDADKIIDVMVAAGAKAAEGAVRSNLRAVLSPEHKDGELIRSLGVSPVLVDRGGVHNAKIGFRNVRSDGKSNAMIAAVLEYGRSGQPARPFLAPAKRKAKKPVIAAMEDALTKEVRGRK